MPVAGGTGERVAREPLTGRVPKRRSRVRRSGPVGERATPTPGQDPLSLRGPAPPGRRLLAALLSRWRTAHATTAAWTGRAAFWMIAPDDVSVIVG